jgi:glutamyl-tRNA reductase
MRLLELVCKERLHQSDIIFDPMALHVLGINHQSAPLEIREKLAFPPERQAEALSDLAGQPGVDEAVLVSTCNRTEVYLRGAGPEAARGWLAREAAKAGIALEPHLYSHSGERAVRHAFRVAAGMDSMVVGEPQILGQVKQAVRNAQAVGTLGTSLARLFQQAFSAAKKVRSDTALGAQSVSMAAASLRIAQNLFGDLARTRMLLIGVGEMVELAATYFVAQRPRGVVVANRTLARGESFAERFEATAIALSELPSRLHEFDVVITGTASQLPILGKGLIESALRTRRHRPMFIVDFAVPRDVEPEVASLADVFLYTIDDLGKIVQQGAESRRAAMAEAELIVDAQVAEFDTWQRSRAAVPAIIELRRRADLYRESELARARARLARGEPAEAVLDGLAKGLANKFLHHPSQALSRAPAAEREQLVRAIEALFPEPDTPEAGER